MEKPLNIAVVGSGIAGTMATYCLDKKHNITLIEKNDYVGGHTNTINVVEGPDKVVPVDTGFIVLNDTNYPVFQKFLKNLGVEIRYSDMSFAYWSKKKNLYYSSISFNTIFSQRRNFFRPSFWRMLIHIPAFFRKARKDLHSNQLENLTLGEYIKKEKFPEPFLRWYLYPMGAAIWSTPFEQMMEFPAASYIRFYEQHGVLDLREKIRWQTVVGGSQTYIKAFLKGFKGKLLLNAKIEGITRHPNGVEIEINGKKENFDKVILATHADQALALLKDPRDYEKELLGCWKYEKNLTVLHTDRSIMPKHRRAWASWNYYQEDEDRPKEKISLTYHMNRLQGLKTEKDYFVTLNSTSGVHKDHIIKEIDYEHPIFNRTSFENQVKLKKLNGENNTFYCGSYLGYGFHEDGARSGLAVAEALGCSL